MHTNYEHSRAKCGGNFAGRSNSWMLVQFKRRFDTGVGAVSASKNPPCSIAPLEVLRLYPRPQLRESTGSCDRFVPVSSAAGGTERRAEEWACSCPVVLADCRSAVDERRPRLLLMGGVRAARPGARDSSMWRAFV